MGVGSRQVKQHCPGPSHHSSRGQSSSGHGVKEHSTSPFWKRAEGYGPVREVSQPWVTGGLPPPLLKVTKESPGSGRERKGESFPGGWGEAGGSWECASCLWGGCPVCPGCSRQHLFPPRLQSSFCSGSPASCALSHLLPLQPKNLLTHPSDHITLPPKTFSSTAESKAFGPAGRTFQDQVRGRGHHSTSRPLPLSTALGQ